EQVAERLVGLIQKIASNLIIGHPRGDHPVFAGPIISPEAREAVLGFQASAAGRDGRVLLESTALERPGGGHYITPGLLEVERFSAMDSAPPRDGGGTRDAGCDIEVFGPLLRFAVVKDLDV